VALWHGGVLRDCRMGIGERRVLRDCRMGIRQVRVATADIHWQRAGERRRAEAAFGRETHGLAVDV
jgi:hypothetical protein